MQSTFFLLFFSVYLQVQSQSYKIDSLQFSSVADTKKYFHFSNNEKPIISGHRGGATDGYPENCIATLEYTLNSTPAIFEIDVRLTKDNELVLLHDESLNRTTTGSGRLKDFTLEEVKNLKLKDPNGTIAPYSIPTLAEAIEWSKGKTVLNLDVKDVPLKAKAEIVKQYEAFSHVIFTVHSAEQAKFFYDFDSRSMFSAFIKTKAALQSYEDAGIPWENILIAYVGSESTNKKKELYDLLHQKGIKITVSAARTYDKLDDPEERAKAYKHILKNGADVIESDRPTEVAKVIKIDGGK